MGKEDRFKAFLYLVDERCVGLCLAERIHCSAKVLPASSSAAKDKEGVEIPPSNAITIAPRSTDDAVRSSSISVSTAKDAALLGISRIWTSKSYR